MSKPAEAFFNQLEILDINALAIKELKKRAAALPRKRFRLCLHDGNENKMQEMIIAAEKGSYIRPHRHPKGKSESYHVIEGTMRVCYFDDQGKIIRFIDLAKPGGKKPFMQRNSGNIWHMPIPTSKCVVYHETYPGPFLKEYDVEYPDWAPLEQDKAEVKKFFARVLRK